MLYKFTATVKAPGQYMPCYSGTVQAASLQAAKVAARLETSAAMGVPDVCIKKLKLREVM